MPGLLRVGLTGGIACGRSTLSAHLRRPGWLLLDADAIGHALLAPGGGAVSEVIAAFGEEVRDASGGISRPALGRRVFADAEARRALEAILHPRILAAIEAEGRAFEARCAAEGRDGGIAVADAALMIETGTYRRYHRVVVAHCPRAVQLERLMARDALSREEAEARLAAQAPIEEKIAAADYLIDTGGTLDETRDRTLLVASLLEEDQRDLPRLAPRGSGGPGRTAGPGREDPRR